METNRQSRRAGGPLARAVSLVAVAALATTVVAISSGRANAASGGASVASGTVSVVAAQPGAASGVTPMRAGAASARAGAASARVDAASARVDAASVEAPTPSYDFLDCPPIPDGAEPARWRCEVLTANGSMTMGDATFPSLSTITITHAEGPMPDGTPGQVWGGLRSDATSVPGGLTGVPAAERLPLLDMALRPQYGGTSDFSSDGDSPGVFTLRFRARRCT